MNLSAGLAQGAAAGVSPAALKAEAPFLAENNAAMARMMAGMAVRPTGNIDHDFVALMVPHHQGAIDMAKAELLHGHDEKLLRIAQEIIVEQLQEIAAMRLAVGEPASPTWRAGTTAPAPNSPPLPAPGAQPESSFLAQTVAAMNRMMAAMAVEPSGNVDRDFVALMVPHHRGAIDMAEAELRYGGNRRLKTIAQEIIVDQQQEITLMRLAVGESLPAPASSPTQLPTDGTTSATRMSPSVDTARTPAVAPDSK